MSKHCFILGTRPEIIKLFPVIKYCIDNNIEYFIIHTNQHYSENMDAVFFRELSLPYPKYNLGINGGNHWIMTGKMMGSIEKILLSEIPDIVYIQWDTNTVLAGALVASKIPWIKVAHIEAGLRSYDRSMPEEINRIVTDHISDILFVPTEKQRTILLSEWISHDKIIVTGNTIVDAVLYISRIAKKDTGKILEKYWVKADEYILLTSHRPSNVDQKETLKDILLWVENIAKNIQKRIIFPVHPRTKKNIISFWLEKLISNFIVIEPVWFYENIILESNASMIITDSGGIQEEWCVLQKKTLILRDNTERPETLDVGGAILVWNNITRIIEWFNTLKDRDVSWYNPFWDGKSAEHIISFVQWIK